MFGKSVLNKVTVESGVKYVFKRWMAIVFLRQDQDKTVVIYW